MKAWRETWKDWREVRMVFISYCVFLLPFSSRVNVFPSGLV